MKTAQSWQKKKKKIDAAKSIRDDRYKEGRRAIAEAPQTALRKNEKAAN